MQSNLTLEFTILALSCSGNLSMSSQEHLFYLTLDKGTERGK